MDKAVQEEQLVLMLLKAAFKGLSIWVLAKEVLEMVLKDVNEVQGRPGQEGGQGSAGRSLQSGGLLGPLSVPMSFVPGGMREFLTGPRASADAPKVAVNLFPDLPQGQGDGGDLPAVFGMETPAPTVTAGPEENPFWSEAAKRDYRAQQGRSVVGQTAGGG